MQLTRATFNPDHPFLLRPHRVHEVEGLGQIAFALYQAHRHAGPVIWLQLDHHDRDLMPLSLPPGVNERLHMVRCASEDDLLWACEEVLRSPPVGLMIATPAKALGLTAGRRLQLAAEAGQTTGLMLIQTGQGSNAAETRWHCRPAPISASADAAQEGAENDMEIGPSEHRWRCIKNKSGALRDWAVRWDGISAICTFSPANSD